MQLINANWEYIPGDRGDPSVGIGPSSPSICAEIETPDGLQSIELAQLIEPIYTVRVDCPGVTCPHWTTEEVDDGGYCLVHSFDDGVRYVDDVNEVGVLMTAAPRLLKLLNDALSGTDGWQTRAERLVQELAENGAVEIEPSPAS